MDLTTLNDRQKEAVLHSDGALAVLSSAGSGKTRTVTTKIAYLVTEKEVRPTRIWACTFTNKAANEMKERLEPIIGAACSSVKMSTIHSLAYKLMRDAKKSKEAWFKMPEILKNEWHALSHLYKFCRDKNLPNKNAKMYLQEIANLKLDLITVKNFKQFRPYDVDPDKTADEPIDDMTEALHVVYKEYERWLEKNNKMDFQDMLVGCYKTLSDPKYAKYVEGLQNRVEYLIVDEAQDTNTVSFKILEIMAGKHRNVTIVGDTRQLIYSFQGARMENIENFIKMYQPKMIDLNTNYRSTRNIVDNANKLISFAKDTIGEPAITPNVDGPPIMWMNSGSVEDEAGKVFDAIESLHYAGTDWKDMAVLYRVHSQAVAIEDYLMMHDIPYVTFSKQSFYQRKEIIDLVEYLKIFTDPKGFNNTQLKRLANKPSRFISNKAIGELEDFAFDSDMELWDALKQVHNSDIASFQKEKLDVLYEHLYKGIKKFKNGASPKELAEYVLNPEGLGYEAWAVKERMEKTPDVDVAMNFDAILGTLQRFETPLEFFEFLDQMKEEDKSRKSRQDDPDYNGVKLMTIHASKGKEFKKVILMGVCDRMYPFYKAREEGNSDEERRVMYVALTRPETHLYLSVIDGNMGRYNVRPSNYLHEMNINYTRGSDNAYYGQASEIKKENEESNKKDFFQNLVQSLED